MRSILPLALLMGAACVEPAGVDPPTPPTPTRDAGPDVPDAGELPDAGVPPGCASVQNQRPAAPTLSAPAAGAVDVVPDTMQVVLGPFVDLDGDAHRGTEIEIWRVRGGVPDTRVWRFTSTDAALSASLAQGQLENEAADAGGLAPWRDHTVRARVADDSGACDPWSAWSADVPFRTDDGSSALFDGAAVRTFEVTLPESSVDAINAEAWPPGCVRFPRSYHPGSLTVDGRVFEGVGVRIKGGCGSSRDLYGKPSLKIALEWDDPLVDGCPAPRRFLGQKTLTLHNGVQDPSAMHEELGYALYRAAGVPAPRVAHAWLRVNGEDYGLYQLVETIDRRFLARFFSDARGMMYEGAYWCDLVAQNIPAPGEDASCISREFEPGPCDEPLPDGADVQDWELLRGLVADLDLLGHASFYPAVRELLDFDAFLSMWAVDAVLSHWDAYSFHIVNNYRLYHEPSTGLFTLMPWGIDQTFEGGGDVDPWSTSARLVDACTQDPACDAAFAARLYEVTALFESLALDARAGELHELLAPWVEADPRKEYSTNAWHGRYAELLSWIAERPTRVRQRLTARGYPSP